MYRKLDASRIVATADALVRRVQERFPGSGLAGVAAELRRAADATTARLEELTAPRLGLRVATGGLVALLLLVVLFAVSQLRIPGSLTDVRDFVQVLESGTNDVVFIGIAVFFLTTIEGRLKRRAALRSLDELRSLAHVIDMHQLTKDPDRYLSGEPDTAASPVRVLSGAGLGRYLDYCSEMLSITSKVAALYAQRLDDAVVLGAVNEIEALTSNLSNKIWQKIVVLGRASSEPAAPKLRRVPSDPRA